MFSYLSVAILWCCFPSFHYITSLSVSTSLPDDSTNPTTLIDLASYDKLNKSSQSFLNYLNISSDCILNIDVVNAPSNGGFFIIQFHSLKANFSLSNVQNESVTGRNTGLVEVNLQDDVLYQYQLRCVHELKSNTKVLIAVVVYEKEDPIPGGCNLTFKPKISPYQNITYTDNIVQVDVQPSSILNAPCEHSPVSLEMYHLYLREQTLDEDEYFEGISKMLTSESIVKNAHIVPRPDEVLAGRRYYSAYLGTGAVYGVVVKSNGRVAAYIPAVSYACDTDNWDESCVAPITTIWKIITAILLFVGSFSLYAGHICFKGQTFVVGFLYGSFGGYIIYALTFNYTGGGNVVLASVLGVLCGIMWLALWWRFGFPIVTVSLSVFAVAYIICCIIFYSSVGDLEYFRRNLNYWGIFLSMIVLLTIPLMIHTKYSHIFACAFLGATAVCISINHYTGGNLHYIFLNNFRRATILIFNKAIIEPLFQYSDVLLSVLWLVLSGSGITVQIKSNRGRAPFPPRPHYDNLYNGSRLFFRTYIFRNVFHRSDESRPFVSDVPSYS